MAKRPSNNRCASELTDAAWCWGVPGARAVIVRLTWRWLLLRGTTRKLISYHLHRCGDAASFCDVATAVSPHPLAVPIKLSVQLLVCLCVHLDLLRLSSRCTLSPRCRSDAVHRGEPCVPSYRSRKRAVLRCCSLIAIRVRLQAVKERRCFAASVCSCDGFNMNQQFTFGQVPKVHKFSKGTHFVKMMMRML
ncbi:hypothetical protein PS704_01341 [Pseudomonas fluorescens]|uniref:Uncharacterized protein n=1 Tax=Pseudomonas fluorescens TaxID=294 RepID=A0A5E7BET1_PSEFL|nr:hypothetical protein PS704_01341 [Pseudomonas fluorescens]